MTDDTVDIEEMEGRAAYNRGERWSMHKPERWRLGWIHEQNAKAPAKHRAERELLKLARKPRTRREFEIDAFENVAKPHDGGRALTIDTERGRVQRALKTLGTPLTGFETTEETLAILAEQLEQFVAMRKEWEELGG